MTQCNYCYNDINKEPYISDSGVPFCSEICYNRLQVMRLFKWRCALNSTHYANVIHEIIPRSLRPKDWWKLDNMVPLCWNCHERIHANGTRKFKSQLQEILKNASRKLHL